MKYYASWTKRRIPAEFVFGGGVNTPYGPAEVGWPSDFRWPSAGLVEELLRINAIPNPKNKNDPTTYTYQEGRVARTAYSEHTPDRDLDRVDRRPDGGSPVDRQHKILKGAVDLANNNIPRPAFVTTNQVSANGGAGSVAESSFEIESLDKAKHTVTLQDKDTDWEITVGPNSITMTDPKTKAQTVLVEASGNLTDIRTKNTPHDFEEVDRKVFYFKDEHNARARLVFDGDKWVLYGSAPGHNPAAKDSGNNFPGPVRDLIDNTPVVPEGTKALIAERAFIASGKIPADMLNDQLVTAVNAVGITDQVGSGNTANNTARAEGPPHMTRGQPDNYKFETKTSSEGNVTTTNLQDTTTPWVMEIKHDHAANNSIHMTATNTTSGQSLEFEISNGKLTKITGKNTINNTEKSFEITPDVPVQAAAKGMAIEYADGLREVQKMISTPGLLPFDTGSGIGNAMGPVLREVAPASTAPQKKASLDEPTGAQRHLNAMVHRSWPSNTLWWTQAPYSPAVWATALG